MENNFAILFFAVLGILAGLAGGRFGGHCLTTLLSDEKGPPVLVDLGAFVGAIIGFVGMILLAAKFGVKGCLIGIVLIAPATALVYAAVLLVCGVLVYAGGQVVSFADRCGTALTSAIRRLNGKKGQSQ